MFDRVERMKDMVEKNTLAENVIKLMDDLLRWRIHIERAVRDLDGMYTFDDIVASILRQERHFYEFDGCCVIMQKDTYPGYSTYHCFVACGTTAAILDAEPFINKIAKELGCKYMSFTGRTGWPRRLKNHGWVHKLSTMHKEVY